MTIEELYENIFYNLNGEDNIFNGLTKMWIDIKSNSGETYKIDEFLDGELVKNNNLKKLPAFAH